jgi:hypothetical protein
MSIWPQWPPHLAPSSASLHKHLASTPNRTLNNTNPKRQPQPLTSHLSLHSFQEHAQNPKSRNVDRHAHLLATTMLQTLARLYGAAAKRGPGETGRRDGKERGTVPHEGELRSEAATVPTGATGRGCTGGGGARREGEGGGLAGSCPTSSVSSSLPRYTRSHWWSCDSPQVQVTKIIKMIGIHQSHTSK